MNFFPDEALSTIRLQEKKRPPIPEQPLAYSDKEGLLLPDKIDIGQAVGHLDHT